MLGAVATGRLGMAPLVSSVTATPCRSTASIEARTSCNSGSPTSSTSANNRRSRADSIRAARADLRILRVGGAVGEGLQQRCRR